jgi:ABC-type dipeptide/oligopeptide/nickel transport system permease component
LLTGVVTVWIIVTIAFAVVRVAPGDPAEIWLGDYATPALVQLTRERMGLDTPIWQQYGTFVSRVAAGDLGTSIRTNRPVTQTIFAQVPHTLRLTFASISIGIALGLALGVLSALHHNSTVDFLSVLGSVVWLSIPSFWFGMILIYLFAVKFKWFPITGAGDRGDLVSLLHHLVLPAVALGARQAAVITRMSRSAMLDVLRADYVRTARAKGLSERRIISRHVVRNSLIPVLSLTGIEIMIVLSGSIVIETVFSRPGVGQLLVTAVAQRDYPLIQGVIFFFAFAVILINVLTDIGYAIVDPRVRLD